MGFSAIIVLSVIVLMILFLYKETLRPSLIFLAAVMALLLAGVISPSEALHGFGNEQLALIVMLLILSNTLGETRLIQSIFQKIFSLRDSPKVFMIKMLASVGLSSAFLNNTPLVAIMMPYVNAWTKAKNEPISHYLIPLSFASILGGCVTLIGTSTNLIANGLAIEYGEEGLQIFDFAYAALPMLVIGSLYILWFSKKLLPAHSDKKEERVEREYFVEIIVEENSPLAGQTLEQAGLRNMKGLFLIEIIKRRATIRPASPDAKVRVGDKLIFAGDTKSIAELNLPALGLSLPSFSKLPENDKESVIEVVVSPNSILIGQPIKDSDFRSLYNGAIMAVHRNGERLSGKIGDLELQAGDMLLVLAGRDFLNRLRRSTDFYLVSQVQDIPTEDQGGAWALTIGLLIAITLAILDVVPLFTSTAFLVVASILMGMQKLGEMRKKIDFDLIIIIAMGLALGKSMINSGLAGSLAASFSEVMDPFGSWGLLFGFFLLTNLLTAFMTSKAAIAILLPIAISIAHTKGLPVPAFILIVAYGGAASFSTPIGYQTNLMVYGPGGYTFSDYFRIGFPLTLIYGLVATTVLIWLYGL
jgi:di/tricarboxylate transporter